MSIDMCCYQRRSIKKCLRANYYRRWNGDNQGRIKSVQQSRGWIHYEIHKPEPFILLFRRPLNCDPNTGLPPANWRDPGY